MIFYKESKSLNKKKHRNKPFLGGGSDGGSGLE